LNMNDKDPIAVELGKRGGDKTLQKYGKDHFKKLSDKAAEVRKAKKIAQS